MKKLTKVNCIPLKEFRQSSFPGLLQGHTSIEKRRVDRCSSKGKSCHNAKGDGRQVPESAVMQNKDVENK